MRFVLVVILGGVQAACSIQSNTTHWVRQTVLRLLYEPPVDMAGVRDMMNRYLGKYGEEFSWEDQLWMRVDTTVGYIFRVDFDELLVEVSAHEGPVCRFSAKDIDDKKLSLLITQARDAFASFDLFLAGDPDIFQAPVSVTVREHGWPCTSALPSSSQGQGDY